MTAPINPPDLDTALKTLWGASHLPFSAAVAKPYASHSLSQFSRQLEQLVAVRSCGLVYGPHGVGKTLLIQHFLALLPDKRFKTIFLAHSSVTGTDLLRLLCRELGRSARMRRGDNLMETRLSFCLELQPWSMEELQGYLQARLQEAGIHTALFEESALHLVLQAAHGLPRILNHLAQRALEQAAGQNCRLIASAHVQSALQLMPWLAKL